MLMGEEIKGLRVNEGNICVKLKRFSNKRTGYAAAYHHHSLPNSAQLR